MATLRSLNELNYGAQSERRSEAALVDLDDRGNQIPSSYRIFQYFPESIRDSKEVNWADKEIPGGSLPIQQWISSGARNISFTAVFTCDVDYYATQRVISGNLLADPRSNAVDLANRIKSLALEDRNVFIPSALIWLRRYMLPSYGTGSNSGVGATGAGIASVGQSAVGSPLTFAPRKCLLIMPGMSLGAYGGFSGDVSFNLDTVNCIMKQCEISIEVCFPSGLPRYATVELSFTQTAQRGGQVIFPSVTDAMEQAVIAHPDSSVGYRLPSRRPFI